MCGSLKYVPLIWYWIFCSGTRGEQNYTAAAARQVTICADVSDACAGALYATNIGALTPLGLEGWRFAFLSVAVVSALIGVLTFFLGHDPRFVDDRCILFYQSQAACD